MNEGIGGRERLSKSTHVWVHGSLMIFIRNFDDDQLERAGGCQDRCGGDRVQGRRHAEARQGCQMIVLEKEREEESWDTYILQQCVHLFVERNANALYMDCRGH